jgi:hypothetical protein
MVCQRAYVAAAIAHLLKQLKHLVADFLFRSVSQHAELVQAADKRHAVAYLRLELPWLLVSADAHRRECLRDVRAVGDKQFFNSASAPARVIRDQKTERMLGVVHPPVIGQAIIAKRIFRVFSISSVPYFSNSQ